MRIGPHGVCDDCRTVPCECQPEPAARPSKRLIGRPISVTFTDEQIEWLQGKRDPGEPLTAVVRRCVQEIMNGAVQPCTTGHCYKRRQK